MCTKNYAEWRTGRLDSKHGHYTQIVQVSFLGSDILYNLVMSCLSVFLFVCLGILVYRFISYHFLVFYFSLFLQILVCRYHETKVEPILQEGVPISLESHKQEIEHLLTDGHLILSHCIGGKICIWDSLTGETISTLR